MKTTILSIVLLITFIVTDSALAQPGLPSDPSQAPIDGGIIWMLIAGGAYGLKKLWGDQNE